MFTTTHRIDSKSFSSATRSSFLEKIRSGDEKAWFQFREKYIQMIRHIGRLRGLTDEECDDLMTEVMVIFWKKMEHFIYDSTRGKFRSYLGRIADFASLKMLRKKRKDVTCPLTGDYPDELDCTAMDEWRDYLMQKALEELQNSVDTVTYQAFYMLVFQKRTIAEVSAVTRKTPNTLYGIRSRCTRKLKTIITAYRQFDSLELPIHSHKNKLPY